MAPRPLLAFRHPHGYVWRREKAVGGNIMRNCIAKVGIAAGVILAVSGIIGAAAAAEPFKLTSP